jgi:hypothetical protein
MSIYYLSVSEGTNEPGFEDREAGEVWKGKVPDDAVTGYEVGEGARDKEDECEQAEGVEEGEAACVFFF